MKSRNLPSRNSPVIFHGLWCFPFPSLAIWGLIRLNSVKMSLFHLKDRTKQRLRGCCGSCEVGYSDRVEGSGFNTWNHQNDLKEASLSILNLKRRHDEHLKNKGSLIFYRAFMIAFSCKCKSLRIMRTYVWRWLRFKRKRGDTWAVFALSDGNACSLDWPRSVFWWTRLLSVDNHAENV